MKNLIWMRLFRFFVVCLVGTYVLLSIHNIFVKVFILFLLFVLVLYYWEYICNIFYPAVYYILILVIAFFLIIFVSFKEEKVKECKWSGNGYDILIIREAVNNGDFNSSLGKVMSGDCKDMLVMIRSSVDEVYLLGDKIHIKSGLEENNSKSNYFDSIFFGRVKYQLNFIDAEVTGKAEVNLFLQFISWLRNKIDNNILDIIGPKHHDLVSMWILGKTKVNNSELSGLFRNLGISHILVISGTHLAILFNIVSYILILFVGSYWLNVLMLMIFLFIFLFLTGVSSSILRATLFWLLIMVGRSFGRIINYTNVLTVVLLTFFVLNPKIILFDVGFHLSFLSISALIYVLPIVNKFIKFKNEKFDFFIKIFNATLAITVVLVPYLMFYFSEFNILSLIFNVFLIPFSGVILSVAFVSIVVSLAWMFLARVLGFISFLMINAFMVCLNLFNNINVNIQWMFFNSVFLVIGYYWLLIILIIDFYINNKDLTLTL